MSAARVLNPVVLSEFCKIRAASPASMVNRNLPCGRQLNRIKRDLFGPANPVETNKIFVEQLEQHQERAIKKWGFDFRAGSPLTPNSQFIWERVSFQESAYAPEMYTLTRAAHVRPSAAAAAAAAAQPPSALDLLMDERAERENANSTTHSMTDETTDDSCDESHDESATSATTSVIFKVPAGRGGAAGGAETTVTTLSVKQLLRKRQPKITEYMKERKRLAQTPKKASPPAKRMRTNSGSNSSAPAHSISAHFSLRSLPPPRNI